VTAGRDVVDAARTHVDTPWRHQGRRSGEALDCAGHVIVVARQLGLVEPGFDINGYSRAPDGSMLELCRRFMLTLPAFELGAVAVLASEKDPHHMGFVGDYRHGGWSLIHASNIAQPPRVVETRLLLSRALRLRGIFRLPGVA
jgi:hypothetical protein